MAKLFLRKKISPRLSYGHLWVYDNEVGDIIGEVKDGDEIDVFTHTGSFLGKAWYHSEASIRARIFSRNDQEHSDKEFFERRFSFIIPERIRANRKIVRLFHAESDGISGLYIERWDTTVLVRTTITALDIRYPIIEQALKKFVPPEWKIIKDDSHPLRKYEELEILEPPKIEGFVHVEDGVEFPIQKVGDFSPDRQLIRSFMGSQARGKVVWDLFCGNGNIATTALLQGAEAVLAVDNEDVFVRHKGNSSVTFIQENVFDFLKKAEMEEQADIVVLDMPAFHISSASLQPYKELGLQSLKRLKPGGLLVCGINSSKITEEQLDNLFTSWMHDLRIQLSLVYECFGAQDFPRHVQYPHTRIPHFYVLKKLPYW